MVGSSNMVGRDGWGSRLGSKMRGGGEESATVLGCWSELEGIKFGLGL